MISEKILYISGPMTGLPDFNIPAFDEAQEKYRTQFCAIANPANVTRDWGDDQPYEFYMRQALANLIYCTHIVMLKGWRQSRGALLELTMAKACGLTVLYDDPEYETQCGGYEIAHFLRSSSKEN